MILRTTKLFDKQYKKLTQKQQAFVKRCIGEFMENPSTPRLRNHALTGHYTGYRSINVTGDIRILYKEDQNVVYLGHVGTHSQLY